ncbi:RING finger type zinc finger protein, partial [uncultured virus]
VQILTENNYSDIDSILEQAGYEIKENGSESESEKEENDDDDIIIIRKRDLLKIPHAWKEEKAADNRDRCVICFENKRTITLNCGHFNTCGHCTRELLRSDKKECPICRTEIISITRTFA